jgi:hypothetical protein
VSAGAATVHLYDVAPLLRSIAESMVMISPVVQETRSISRGPETPPDDQESIIVEQVVIFPMGVLI